jgi:hypothetical protein
MNRIGRRTIMCMALIAVGGDLEFARALNQMRLIWEKATTEAVCPWRVR